MKLFISGPMRGIPYYGFPAFDAARAAFEAAGFDVVTPADLDRQIGFDAMTLPEDTDWHAESMFDIRAAMARNISALCDCGRAVFLSGWKESSGCRIEMEVADRCSIPCMIQDTAIIEHFAQYVQKIWTDCAGNGEV